MGQLADQIRGANRADLGMQAQDMMARMGLAQQGQQNMYQMLFNSMNQANQLGTPQAQTVQTPSAFGQAMGAISGLAPYALAPFTGGASLGLGGMFGRGAASAAGGMSKAAGAGMTPGGGSMYGSGFMGLGVPQYPGR